VIVTGNDVAGHCVVACLGVVRGIVVRSPSSGKGVLSAFESLGGGNIQ
jgi:uncharacterized protein YbjQ (UPF0145 family)